MPPIRLTMTNPGAEAGTTTGWTNVTGTLAAIASGGGILPYTGSYFFRAGASATTECYQDIAIPADYHAGIDAGAYKAVFTAFQAGYTDADTGSMGLAFYSGAPALISSVQNENIDAEVWERRTLGQAVPAGTRTIRVILYGVRASGTNLDAYWDNMSLDLVEVDPDLDIGVSDGLDLWLAGYDAPGDDGAAISTWADRSGNGNDFTASGSARPVARGALSRDLDYRRGVFADASDDSMTGGDILNYSGNAGLTIFAVLQESHGTNGDHEIVGRDASGDRGWGLYLDAEGRPALIIASGASTGVRRDGARLSVGGFRNFGLGSPGVVTARYDGAAGEMSLWVNGVLDNGAIDGSVPATIANDGPADCRVFSGGFSYPAGVLCGDIIVFNRALSDAERETVESALMSYYQIYQMTRVTASPDLNDLQGVATDGTEFWTSDAQFTFCNLQRWNDSWVSQANNTTPFSGLAGTYDHMGDPCEHAGVIYVGATSPASILKFDATTLARSAAVDVSATADRGSASAVAYDTVNDYVVLAEHVTTGSGTNRLLRYNASDLSYVDTVDLDMSIPAIQGFSYGADGYLWAVSGAYDDRVWRIDPSDWSVRIVMRRGDLTSSPDEIEGVDFTQSGLFYWLVRDGSTEQVETWSTVAPSAYSPGGGGGGGGGVGALINNSLVFA